MRSSDLKIHSAILPSACAAFGFDAVIVNLVDLSWNFLGKAPFPLSRSQSADPFHDPLGRLLETFWSDSIKP